MKRFYLKVRIGLMTFALGLASVFVINGSLQFLDEVTVNLPETESGEVIVIHSKYPDEVWWGGGGCGGIIKESKSERKEANGHHKKRKRIGK